ncbi:MAG: arylsulfatase [Chitinophagaceae bacterium]|nr:arylsulfatase [Chitinophagaceae bacterium]
MKKWGVLCLLQAFLALAANAQQPNVVLIYADDVGYGDLGSYGNTCIPTPNLDRLAAGGQRFTRAYTSAATCTPSRYALLTGRYNWRQQGTGIAAGNAGLIIDTTRLTLPKMMQRAGYATGMIGKWHLGLGGQQGPDWNGRITPGVRQSGFDYAFFMPSTNDRVPCVFIENDRVVAYDPADPIAVSYAGKIGTEPTGAEAPHLLTMHPSHGHNQTIINGISRIGYMTGGKAARWRDQDIADIITQKAISFMAAQQQKPFLLYYNPHDIHVPRTPHERFAGKSGYGLRGDALLELDWCVGQLLHALDSLKLTSNTIVIFSSDNGPVVDDGYMDKSVEELGRHKPAGPLRGGKYSIFEAGTRVPLLVSWPGKIAPGTSNALISQLDLMASLAIPAGANLPAGAAEDTRNYWKVFAGKSKNGRKALVTHAQTYALVQPGWKYIEPARGNALFKEVNIESGLLDNPQLYQIATDTAEQNNLAGQYPKRVKRMQQQLNKIKAAGKL